MRCPTFFLRLIQLVGLFMFCGGVIASDRSGIVHSRVSSALSGFLGNSDYLVIVRKSDMIDDATSSNAPTGALMKLPGLPVAVDSAGKLVKNADDSQGAYQGPIELTVVIDNNVKKETVDLIQKMLPDIMGTSNDEDSIRVQRASLRQPPAPNNNAPSIVIQNSQPKNEPSSSPMWKDLLSVIALALVGLGVLMWLIGKRETTQNRARQQDLSAQSPKIPELSEKPRKILLDAAKVLGDVDPAIIGLYLLRLLKNEGESRMNVLVREIDLSGQKSILSCYPKWLAQWVHESWKPSGLEEPTEEQTLECMVMVREITLLESELKGNQVKRARFFMENFPLSVFSTALTEGYQLSDRSAMSMWILRPDTVNSFTNSNINPENMPHEVTDSDLNELYKELMQWERKQKVFSMGSDLVSKWKMVLNLCSTLEEHSKKLQEARQKLSESEYGRLLELTVGWHSLDGLDELRQKEFLRSLDVGDLVWAQTQVTHLEKWPMESLMRPLKYRMYQDALGTKSHDTWSAEEVKLASTRVLQLLKGLVADQGGAEVLRDKTKKLAAA